MIGRTYLERGRPVVVLIRWGPGGGPRDLVFLSEDGSKVVRPRTAPRNVLIRREDGTKTVRPFRGLRKPT